MKLNLLILAACTTLIASASVVSAAGKEAKAPKVNKCEKMNETYYKLSSIVIEAFRHGDKGAEIAAVAYDNKFVSLAEANTLYEETDKLQNGLIDSIVSLRELDQAIPSGSSVSLQMIHLKVGTMIESLVQYQNPFTTKLMDATLCLTKSDPRQAADCEADSIVPLYYKISKDDKRIDIYNNLRSSTMDNVNGLRQTLDKELKSMSCDANCPNC